MLRSSFIPLLVLSLMTQGCQQFALFQQAGAVLEKDRAITSDVVAVWETGEGIGLDGLPTRGFAGQILFFTADQRHPEPQLVDGDVTIYVFDDLGTVEENAEPIHQFNFDRESFAQFSTATNLGNAYQVFIPYTKKNFYEVTCSLRIKLTPEHGLPVYSKLASVILPGAPRPSPQVKSDEANQVQQASYESRHWSPQQESQRAGTGTPLGNSISSKTVPVAEIQRNRLKSLMESAVLEPNPLPQQPSRPLVEPRERTLLQPNTPNSPHPLSEL